MVLVTTSACFTCSASAFRPPVNSAFSRPTGAPDPLPTMPAEHRPSAACVSTHRPQSAQPPKLPNSKAVGPTAEASSTAVRTTRLAEHAAPNGRGERANSTTPGDISSAGPECAGYRQQSAGSRQQSPGHRRKRARATTDLRPRSAVRRRPSKNTTAILGDRGFSWRAPRPSARAANHPTRHASIFINSLPKHLGRLLDRILKESHLVHLDLYSSHTGTKSWLNRGTYKPKVHAIFRIGKTSWD